MFVNDKPNFKWLREKQVQELLGLKRTTLYNMRKMNLIKWSMIGHSVFYDLDSIHNYIESNSSRMTSLNGK